MSVKRAIGQFTFKIVDSLQDWNTCTRTLAQIRVNMNFENANCDYKAGFKWMKCKVLSHCIKHFIPVFCVKVFNGVGKYFTCHSLNSSLVVTVSILEIHIYLYPGERDCSRTVPIFCVPVKPYRSIKIY